MITCTPFQDTGSMVIAGTTPNGNATVTRTVDGVPPLALRGSPLVISTGGINLTDSEAPLGVPLKYEARISGISSADRLIQQNLMLTPHFTLGQFGWATQTGRTFTLTADATAHQATVGHASPNAGGVAPAAAPVFVGHADSPMSQNASYTLNLPTTGGTPVATNDWMILVHNQALSVAFPAAPAGWTQLVQTQTSGGAVRRVIWIRKRIAGDVSVTVAALAGSNSHGTVMWVRGAMDEILVTAGTGRTETFDPATLTYTTQVISQPMSVIRPSLAIVLNLEAHQGSVTPPSAGTVTGATWQYNQATGSASPTSTVATSTQALADNLPTSIITYTGQLDGATGITVVLQAASDLISRTFAVAKAAAIPGPVTQPYLLTGRFKYTTPGLNSWQDIKNIGTWTAVKAAKASWLIARGAQSTVPQDYTKVFLTIVNPTDQSNYIQPIQVMDANETRANQWIDFSAYISPATTIPTTAEIRLVHGTMLREYAIDWYLDEFGLTPGAQRAAHSTLYWFAGNSTLPTNPPPVTFMLGDGWTDTSGDSAISWVGTAGNSVSQFLGPSGVSGVTTCQLDVPANVPCEPMFLSDPVNVSLSMWVGLIKLGDPVLPAQRALYRAINRSPAISVTARRSWEDSQLTVLTETLDARAELINILGTGRVLLIRNPETMYPENNWYISIADVSESRIFEDQRRPERLWALPYTRVERPTGLIEATNAQTWAQFKAIGSWLDARTLRGKWINALTGDVA